MASQGQSQLQKSLVMQSACECSCGSCPATLLSALTLHCTGTLNIPAKSDSTHALPQAWDEFLHLCWPACPQPSCTEWALPG